MEEQHGNSGYLGRKNRNRNQYLNEKKFRDRFLLGKEKSMYKRVSVTSENNSGRNVRFKDNANGKEMTRSQFVKEIEKGNYDNYHIRIINDIKTPVSNPDKRENNNLG